MSVLGVIVHSFFHCENVSIFILEDRVLNRKWRKDMVWIDVNDSTPIYEQIVNQLKN